MGSPTSARTSPPVVTAPKAVSPTVLAKSSRGSRMFCWAKSPTSVTRVVRGSAAALTPPITLWVIPSSIALPTDPIASPTGPRAAITG